MEVKIQKWGNSLALRIPRAFSKDTKISDGTVVEMTMKKGEIVIKPKVYDLQTMLSKITDSNQHSEVDLGEPMGRELL